MSFPLGEACTEGDFSYYERCILKKVVVALSFIYFVFSLIYFAVELRDSIISKKVKERVIVIFLIMVQQIIIICHYALNNSTYTIFVLLFSQEALVQFIYLAVFYHYSSKMIRWFEQKDKLLKCINILTVCILVYIIVIIAISTNFTYRYFQTTLCESHFWLLVRVSGIVIVVILILLLYSFQNKVFGRKRSADSLKREKYQLQHRRKQLKRLWIYLIVFSVSTALLLAYDIGWFVVDTECKYLIHVVWAESFVWFIARVVNFYIRTIISWWALCKRTKAGVPGPTTEGNVSNENYYNAVEHQFLNEFFRVDKNSIQNETPDTIELG